MTEKPRLILHIGTPKTGTSALQMCLTKNQNFLLENKICYSNFYKTNHIHLTYSLMREYCEKMGESMPTIPPHDKDLNSSSSETVVNEMKDIFYKNKCDTLIISYEDLFESTGYWYCHFSVNTERLIFGRRDYLIRYFKEKFNDFDIKIVCYLRRQDDYIESFYNQAIKNSPPERYNSLFNYPDNLNLGNQKYSIVEDSGSNIFIAKMLSCMLDLGYYTNLSQWAEIYGKENIIVRAYEKSQLPNGIEYDFFTNVLNFNKESLAELELNKEINVSLKKDIMEYKREIQTFCIEKKEWAKLNNTPALDYLAENNKKNILTAKQAEDMLEFYKEDNEKIAREYLNREDGILFYDKRREEKDDYQGLSMQAALDISRELILILKKNERRKLKKEKNKIKDIQAELVEEQTKAKNIQDKLEQERAKTKNIQDKLEQERTKTKNIQVKLEKEKTKLNNLYQSASWKITKPLRAVKRLVVKK